jgi:hypothetical protein
MNRTSILCAASFACVAFVIVGNGALAEPPDPCKSGCPTGKGSHLKPQLNPQPLPPGIYRPGGGTGTINPAIKIHPTVSIKPGVPAGLH